MNKYVAIILVTSTAKLVRLQFYWRPRKSYAIELFKIISKSKFIIKQWIILTSIAAVSKHWLIRLQQVISIKSDSQRYLLARTINNSKWRFRINGCSRGWMHITKLLNLPGNSWAILPVNISASPYKTNCCLYFWMHDNNLWFANWLKGQPNGP